MTIMMVQEVNMQLICSQLLVTGAWQDKITCQTCLVPSIASLRFVTQNAVPDRPQAGRCKLLDLARLARVTSLHTPERLSSLKAVLRRAVCRQAVKRAVSSQQKVSSLETGCRHSVSRLSKTARRLPD